jgi:DNA-binding transcriptional ArsR family regulator
MGKSLSLKEAKAILKSPNEAKREAIEQELAAIGASELTDILSWDSNGHTTMLASDQLTEKAKRSIKKMKVTPTQYGNQLEVEMYDKIAALRLLAKHYGMLNVDTSQNRPSVLGINIKGPETVYDVREKQDDDEETEQKD